MHCTGNLTEENSFDIGLNFPLTYEYSRKVQENQVELKLNETHQLLFYSDEVNVLGDKIDTIKKNTETLIDAEAAP
jgi:hypothetical protein